MGTCESRAPEKEKEVKAEKNPEEKPKARYVSSICNNKNGDNTEDEEVTLKKKI